MLRLDLPSDVAEDLCEALSRVPGEPLEDAAPHLLAVAGLLPLGVRRSLLTFRSDPHSPAAMLISGVPVDRQLPPTPVEGAQRPHKPGRISELILLTIAVLLGEPVAYRAEKDGVLVQDVFPTMSSRDTPSNESSAAGLGFHTELTFRRDVPQQPMHEAAPDHVLLLALRAPAERLASTLVAEATSICARLDDATCAALREPWFMLRAPYSFTRDGDGSRPWSPPVPLLRGPADAPSLAFDTACGVRALNAAAQDALAAMETACSDPDVQEAVRLTAGDLLVIDNRRCAHARSAFPARFDGQDRWLQRAYVRRSIWPHPVASSSYRVLL